MHEHLSIVSRNKIDYHKFTHGRRSFFLLTRLYWGSCSLLLPWRLSKFHLFPHSGNVCTSNAFMQWCLKTVRVLPYFPFTYCYSRRSAVLKYGSFHHWRNVTIKGRHSSISFGSQICWRRPVSSPNSLWSDLTTSSIR